MQGSDKEFDPACWLPSGGLQQAICESGRTTMSRLITPECEDCGTSFAVSEDDVHGSKLHCPNCGHYIEIDDGDDGIDEDEE